MHLSEHISADNLLLDSSENSVHECMLNFIHLANVMAYYS